MIGRLGSGTLAVVLTAALAAGCGAAEDQPSTQTEATTTPTDGTVVDDRQALVLARLLEQNWQRGGARFRGTMPILGTEVTLQGRVDFRRGQGDMTLRDPSGESRRYRWTRNRVYAQASADGDAHVTQRPNPDGDPVHAAIAFLNRLSAETIDNTTNIVDLGARFLGEEQLDGVTVDRYRYGGQGHTTYWVAQQDGRLRQVEARFPDGPLTLTLLSHERIRVSLPRERAKRG